MLRWLVEDVISESSFLAVKTGCKVEIYIYIYICS